ncbi:MAG TPA: PEP-CTERM sorting domain-containing protein [Acetobacteraceae bacterium]|jgi:hypothetical protein
MQHVNVRQRRADRTGFRQASLLAPLCVLGAMLPGAAKADLVYYINNGYHYQQTPFYCGEGAMEMMLDAPAVTSLNAGVTNGLLVAAANNIPIVNGANQTIFVNGSFGFVNDLTGDTALQNQLYTEVWGGLTPRAYATSTGTPPIAVAAVMNFNDGLVHNYVNYNLPATLAYGDLASRTIASAIVNYGVPATVAVEHGAHWIDVNGVTTTNTPTRNGNYAITGFYVRDPWTGLAFANPGLAAAAGYGLGFNTWLRYGVDNLGGGNFRLAPWFQYFNPTGPGGLPRNSYSFIVEPQGPEALDTSDPNTGPGFDSGVPVASILGTPLSAGQAFTDAVSDLSGDPDLSGDLSGGSFDSGDEMDITLQGDSGDGDSDWLVPYDGAGGSNDVTGAALIDADTGLIDEATWFDGTDGINDVSLSQIDAWALDQQYGLLPEDNLSDVVPEPGSLLLLLPGAAALLATRRRRKPA